MVNIIIPILGSINAFGIIWAGLVWMIAGFVAGILVAIPVAFLVLSINRDDYEPQDVVWRVALFVVSGLTLAGLLAGAYQEYQKQGQSSSAVFLHEGNFQQSHLVK